jgi:PilZ domain
MHSPLPEERRRSPRRRLYRVAKIKVGVCVLAHDCILIDISDSGVRLHIPGFDVPDEFVLLLSGDGVVRESTYKVVWRRGHEVGAKFVSVVRSGSVLPDRAF